MRQSLILLLFALACALPAVRCKKTPAPVTGVVDFVAGVVQISTAGKSSPANVGDVVREGMTISTAERSFARVSFGENVLKIYELTELSFPSLSRNPDNGAEKTEMRMEKGTILTSVALKLVKGDSHRVTSDTMIAAVRGTEYLYSVDGVSGVVACYRGAMSVLRAGSNEELLLNAGEMVYVREGKPMKTQKIPAGFRHKDFEYGKDPSYTGAADSVIQQKERIGDAGSAPRKERAAIKKTAASGGEAAGRTAAMTPKKQARPAGGKTAGTAAVAVKKETAAGKEKTAASTAMTAKKETAAKKTDAAATTMPGKKETAAAEDQKTAAPAAKQKQPGALLEKPRVDVPELK